MFSFYFNTHGDSVISWACMAASGKCSLVFIDDGTADRRIKINPDVYGPVFALSQKLQN